MGRRPRQVLVALRARPHTAMLGLWRDETMVVAEDRDHGRDPQPGRPRGPRSACWEGARRLKREPRSGTWRQNLIRSPSLDPAALTIEMDDPDPCRQTIRGTLHDQDTAPGQSFFDTDQISELIDQDDRISRNDDRPASDARAMKIAFLASARPAAQQACAALIERYGDHDKAHADYLVAVGGDGTVLKALHASLSTSGPPVFAMRSEGSVGFLANPLGLDDLPARLQQAAPIAAHPLRAEIQKCDGTTETVSALSEIVLIRDALQAAKLRVTIAEAETVSDLAGDGLIIASPLGSTGYNLSAGGPALRHDSGALALTAIAVHRRSDWFNLIVSDRHSVEVEVLSPDHRPVRLETTEERRANIRHVRIASDRERRAVLLFDRG